MVLARLEMEKRGVSHTMSGMVYKTFTAPGSQVKRGTMTAFNL